MKKKTKGVIYIATGKKYVDEALVSAASLKKHMPALPVTLSTDIDIKSKYIDNVVKINNPKYTFEDKVRYIGKSPYYYTLYLDSDTYVCDDFSELFDLLYKFDVSATHNYGERGIKRRYSGKKVTKSFAPFNSGIILFKKSPKTKKLFSNWLRLYLRDKRKNLSEPHHKKTARDRLNDQPSFREALYESDVRISTLATNYNLMGLEGFANDKIKIIHYRRGLFGPIEKTLNSSLSPRIYLWRDKKLYVFEAPKFNPKASEKINEFIRINNSRYNLNKRLGFLRTFIKKLKWEPKDFGHKMKKKTKGVIYIATGEKYVDEVLVSAASLKKHMPALPVTLSTDIDIKSKYIDNVVKIGNPTYTFEDKVRYISKSPYDYTLYLDADTYICDGFSELFDLLDRFDIAVSKLPLRKLSKLKDIPKSFMLLDSSIILFKKSPKTQKLFSNWLKLHLRDKKRNHINLPNKKLIKGRGGRFKRKTKNAGIPDAPSLSEAIYKSNLRFATLTGDYNFRAQLGFVNGNVKIIHIRGKNLNSISKIINSKHSRRVYVWCDGKLCVF